MILQKRVILVALLRSVISI